MPTPDNTPEAVLVPQISGIIRSWMSSSKMPHVSTIGLLLLGIAMISATCHRRDAEMLPIGPDLKADLVVFFKADATGEQVYKFATETVSNPKEGGYWPLPGIRMTLHVLPIDGHEGEAITFFPEATEAERKYVRSRIDASPIVFKVMENVAPTDIKRVE